jgi:hypothetical protein
LEFGIFVEFGVWNLELFAMSACAQLTLKDAFTNAFRIGASLNQSQRRGGFPTL